MNQDNLHILLIYQKKYFEIINNFFVGVTGKTPQNFSALDQFSESINLMGKEFRGRAALVRNAYEKLDADLRELYSNEGPKVFAAARSIDAYKLNLGGGSRFLHTQLNTVRKSLLFSDIVLIPDPIMPFLEKKRSEEKFSLVLPLQMAFFLLHLSDLINDEFIIPPFFIFPSFEKLLEDHDPQTQEGSKKLMVDFFSSYIDRGISEFEDILDYAKKFPYEFTCKVEKSKLFVSPGGDIGESIKFSLENYKTEMQTWRSAEWCQHMFSLGDIAIIINAICERIQPQYHLLENSDELGSHPYLCIDTHAHYYQLIANMKNANVLGNGMPDHSTVSTLQALTSKRLDFLANISDSQLVSLRKTGENIAFRKNLQDLVNGLNNARINDLKYISSEVCSHLEASIYKHEMEVNKIIDRYKAKHSSTAIGAVITGVSMLPVLAPFSPLLSLGGTAFFAHKYISDKLEERAEINSLSRSMMGVISLAKNQK